MSLSIKHIYIENINDAFVVFYITKNVRLQKAHIRTSYIKIISKGFAILKTMSIYVLKKNTQSLCCQLDNNLSLKTKSLIKHICFCI